MQLFSNKQVVANSLFGQWPETVLSIGLAFVLCRNY